MAEKSFRKDITFLIDTGCDLTHIGSEYITPLNLKLQGKPYKYYDIDHNLHKNYVTWITIDISVLGFKKNVKAIISDSKGCNFLGRNFLNSITVFLLGKDSKYILHV